ncbi:ABC transporter B family member 21-like [Hordeum vulgare subsp. vulgare]|uniref:MDR-like ABC transporter n=1 Tax=Hordeum vulgare subsp. vulgare TaxID=112509 RepID=A0A8I6X095_HORVV|nr:ABC transporter B family member 21-like [Hordeum vulgare subsp. vulgare]
MSESSRAFNVDGGGQPADGARGGRKGGGGGSGSGSVPFHRLFAFADSADAALMLVGAVGAVANGAALPLMTVLFGGLVDAFGGAAAGSGDVLARVSQVSLEFVYLAIASAVASFAQVTCWMITGERQAARIRNMYLRTILRQEIAFFDMYTSTGEVVGRMSGDTVLIQDAMGEKVGKFIQLMVTFFGGFAVAFAQGWLLTLVMVATIPPLVLSGAVMSNVVARMASLGQAAYAEAAVVVEQTVGSIRTVASFTGEKKAVEKYNNSLKCAYSSGVREGLVAAIGMGTVMMLLFCGYSLGVWYGAKLILEKGYTGAQVMNVIFAVLTGSLALGQASPSMKAFAGGQAAAYKMFETINREPEIDAYSTEGRMLDDIQGDIEFRDVHFSYPTRPNEQIFRGFSLSIQSAKTVALVGQSGSGKSTVISLIERFYDPQLGEVLIDGVNIKELQLKWIRSKIGLVSQEPALFAASIRDNIAYGKDNATDQEIRAAAELANASKFIDKLPQGFTTSVGEHGTQLSGGQKQRIAIARAILKDPRILLLDEATSALDTESERIVQEALDRVMTNRTTVIVAHRLTTVRNADTIAVICRGSIVEKGPHHDLLRDPEGAYSQLIRLQETSRASEGASNQNKSGRKSDTGIWLGKQSLANQSSSQRSSRDNSSHHSFSVPFGIPHEIDVQVGCSKNITDEIQQEVPLSRLASLNKPEVPVLILGSVASAISGVIFPIFAILLSNVIKAFYEPPQMLKKDAAFWSSMFLIFGAVYFLSLPVGSYFFSVAGCKLIRRIRLMTFEKVVNMEIGWFDDPHNSSGSIGSRLSSDAAKVRGLVGDTLQLVVQNTSTLVAGLVIAFVSNWELSLIILALIPLIGLNGWIQMKFIQGFSADAKMMYEEASQVANDAVSSIRTVASFSAEEKVMDLYNKKCEGPLQTGIRTGIISGIGFGVSFFLLFGVYGASFYAGARLVEDKKTTFPKVFRVFLALTMAAIGVSHTSTLTSDSSRARSAVSSIFAIVDRKSMIDPSDDAGVNVEPLRGDIEFRHVRFRYPTRPDIQIFEDLCLTIQSGKTVALVGESGSGKSTAISLLQRFYDPDAGHILLDGVDIQKFQVRWLRQQMGLVSQEPALFNDTIRANIAYGKEGEATESDIVSAAQLANAHKFISSLHKGYDTVVGERGAQLSGGQKQRVAIARAVAKDPRILLLDEATSALDAESERAVQDALDRVAASRTTVVVAHRLSTVRGADVIAVVKDGAIVERGTHDALIAVKGGAYASLVALHSAAE